jgi:hypothetical protein
MEDTFIEQMRRRCEEKFFEAAQAIEGGRQFPPTIFVYHSGKEDRMLFSERDGRLTDDTFAALRQYALGTGASAIILVAEAWLTVAEMEPTGEDQDPEKAMEKVKTRLRLRDPIDGSGWTQRKMEAIIVDMTLVSGGRHTLFGEISRQGDEAMVISKEWVDADSARTQLVRPWAD